ncbi:MAG TPA: hypothetical protein VKG61_18130 [Streptosporangiaceae bacterium]|nr:hypothetical protein [Streptosporangiaceae bacterium]
MATHPGAVAGARILGERFARSRQQQNPEGRMPLMDHLRELRRPSPYHKYGLIHCAR